MIDILINYHTFFFAGFLTTLKLMLLIVLLGLVGGVVAGAVASKDPISGRILESAKFLTRIIPALVLLFWFHYPLQTMLGVVIDPFWTAVAVFGLINAISVAYLISNEIKLLPKKYIESAEVLGMKEKEIVRHIEVPLVFKRSFPEIMLLQAVMLEYTLFASLISVPEIFRVAQNVNSLIYNPVPVYSLLIIFFVIILAPLHLYVLHFRKNNKVEYV